MKIGDTVTCVAKQYPDSFLTIGKDYVVIDVDASDQESLPIMVRDDEDEDWWLHVSEFTVKSDELAELRAFKVNALARFPELAKPESDEDAAARFEQQYVDGLDGYYTVRDVLTDAIRWARANPR